EGAYIIVSGKDDCTDKMLSERVKGMRDVVANYPDSDKILLDFYGVDRLSAWLRQFPGVALWVRSKLGKPLTGWKSFGRWTSSLNEKQDEFLFDEYPCVIDINSRQKEPVSILSGIKLVRDKLRHNGSVVRITGLSGVGKTRFAQALFEDDICDNALSKSNVIYGDLGSDLSPTATELVSYLIANDYTSYLVLDNCNPDIHRTLQKEIASHQAKLSLLTIEYDISEDRPEETEVIHIEPSSERVVSSLIQKKFPFLGQVNSKRIAEFSGGNARIALALADRVGPDETLASFSDEALFIKLFMQRKQTPDTLLEAAEVLSLVYSFNVSCNEFNDELSVLSSIGTMERNKLIRNVAELLRRKLAQQRGDWRAILPHALANRLARRALQNIDHNTINNELLKKENFRLFKSCAHRLGYLHDFEPARVLAGTWMKHDGPFYDIAQCSTEQLSVLAHIAPLFPEAVLNAVEKASYEEGFCSRENTNFSIIVRLLRKIAYEEQYFDRAAGLILRFAITEKKGEMNNSIVNELSALFSLYLSGTKATAKQRHFFVKNMLHSCDARQVEIAQEIIQSAFRTSNWTSFGEFNFGARSRDYGWFPKTFREMLDWYIGYIKLLEPLLTIDNKAIRDGVKSVLENNFLELWSYVGCFEILESIVHKYAAGGKWPGMWMAIKRTIYYKGGIFTPEYLVRLETLEALAAPGDYYHEIEAYALSNIREHVEYDGDFEDYVKVNEKINKKIIELGEIAATTPGFIESLAPRLWEKNIDALYPFGKGLAKGAAKPNVMFSKLVGLMQSQKLKHVEPVIFRGFIAGIHDINPVLARCFQETVLTIPELKCHFIDILSATPIASWGAKKLIELAQNEELESSRFEIISYGRMHEAINDNDLASLILAINKMDRGF
ncbi:hypothetical protein N7936_004460, partial [Cronobacter sakazakii]|nr:hypothetical protein [Cronobacter sakazakii]